MSIRAVVVRPADRTHHINQVPALSGDSAAQGMGFCNAATRVFDSRQAQKRRGAPHHLYDSKAAMAMCMTGGASGVVMSSLVPPCTLIAFLKRHGEGSGLLCFLFLWKAFEMQARLRID